MDEKEYYKLLVEQYKIMVGSTEKVTDQRQKTDSFFLTIVTSLISVSFLIGKAFEFSITSIIIMLTITVLDLIIINFWENMIISFGKLNKGKFALIFELEKKLKANLFEREWEILTNKDMIDYKPTTQTELGVVKSFRSFNQVILIAEYIYLLISVYNKPFFLMRGGITGHRNLNDENLVRWLEASVRLIVNDSSIDFGYTCLAQGADELFSKILREKNIKYTAIIPCEKYELTFEKGSIEAYNRSLKQATNVVKLDYDKPSEEAFDVAGKLVVLKSDVLIAIWDGKEAKGLGGTGDIVEFAKREGKKLIHLNTISKSIIETY